MNDHFIGHVEEYEVETENEKGCEIEMIRKPTPYELPPMNTTTDNDHAVAIINYADGTSQRFDNVRKVAHIGRTWVMINFHRTTGDDRDHGKRMTVPYDFISKKGIETTSDVRVSFSEPSNDRSD